MEEPNEDDTFKILVATDIHLGFKEDDPVRGEDSFITFEEILKHAKANEVDFILLGGDLFHRSQPTSLSLHKCIVLLRRYCLGDRPVEVEFLSDQSHNFQHLYNPLVNYEDPNINISIPVFSIHGNHDEPIGTERLSAMDILASTGLINYFGKWTDLSSIDIYPLFMSKGQSKLALYGLSHIHDERLSRLFRDQKVSMPTLENQKLEWFNMFVLHQNRAENRGPKNYIPEEVLPDFLDLAIWGHEHDCRFVDTDKPECASNGVYIAQPGSSVATALVHGESLTKHVLLLKIHKKKFTFNPIPLKTVRPFIFKTVTIPLEYCLNKRLKDISQEKVQDIIETMLSEAETKLTDHPKQPKLPLIRLVASFSNEQQHFNAIRLGMQYQGRVANPIDMMMLKVKKEIKHQKHITPEDVDSFDVDEEKFQETVSMLISQYFEAEQVKPMSVLSVRGMSRAVDSYIQKGDSTAMADIFNYQCNKITSSLCDVNTPINFDNITEIIEKLKLNKQSKIDTEIENILENENRRHGGFSDSDDEIKISSDEDNISKTNTSAAASSRPTRGRGSRGPRRARGARATRK